MLRISSNYKGLPMREKCLKGYKNSPAPFFLWKFEKCVFPLYPLLIECDSPLVGVIILPHITPKKSGPGVPLMLLFIGGPK